MEEAGHKLVPVGMPALGMCGISQLSYCAGSKVTDVKKPSVYHQLLFYCDCEFF